MKEILEQYLLLSGRIPIAIKFLYILLIFLVFGGLVTTRFVYMDVVVKANGIIRPAKERSVVRSATSGIIDSIWISEGQFIKKGDRILSLRNEQNPEIEARINSEMDRKKDLLTDLNLLTTLKVPIDYSAIILKTALYKEQLSLFIQNRVERKINLALAAKEFSAADKLVKERIIAPAEFDSKKSQYLQKSGSLHAALHEQLSFWNLEIERITDELNLLYRQLASLKADNEKRLVVAPVAGFVMGIHDRYSEMFLQFGEILCTISPEDSLVAECFVGPADIGFLYPMQLVSFRIDAFDHKQFGSVQGIIQDIDNDITASNDSPVFKIRCSINQKSVSLKNGYNARLKKGMTVNARFKIAQRTIWQLFFDKLHNWLEPVVTV